MITYEYMMLDGHRIGTKLIRYLSKMNLIQDYRDALPALPYESDNIKEDIDGSFTWSGTPQGHDFWSPIHYAFNKVLRTNGLDLGINKGEFWKSKDGLHIHEILSTENNFGAYLISTRIIFGHNCGGNDSFTAQGHVLDGFPDNGRNLKTKIPASDVWEYREQGKMKTEYFKIEGLEGLTINPQHYLHWSITAGEKLGKVAFTKSVEHGVADRQTVMKLGKYLRQYQDHLLDHEIRDLVGSITAKGMELTLCTSKEDIEEAYRDEASDCSCMNGGKAVVDGIHPSIVFSDTPDVAVAYVEGVGRALINLISGTYYKIYGDFSRLIPILELNGYTEDSDGLSGCTLSYHQTTCGQHVMPYLDGNTTVNLYANDEGKKYWIVGGAIGSDTLLETYNAESTNGTVEEQGMLCPCCENRYDEAEMIYLDNTDTHVCDMCFGNEDDYQVVYMGGYTESVDTSDLTVYEYNGELYEEDSLEYHDLVIVDDEVHSEHDCVRDFIDEGDYILEEDAVMVYSVDDGEVKYTTQYNADTVCEEVPEKLQEMCDGCAYCY